ncbi:MAG TPA: hypothetical protein VGM88_14030 [Kofleriaceae bacterium]|jgi:hypothetical protein
MPARDLNQDVDQDLDQEAPASEVAAPDIEPIDEEQLFTPDGQLPAVADQQSAAAPAPQQSASDLAFQPTAPLAASKNDKVLDSGMHTPDEYKAACEASGQPDRWQHEFHFGHTEAQGFTQPYHKRGGMFNFELQTGMSASKAIQDFLRGPTIADLDTMVVAAELDKVRGELGDDKFDRLFGSANLTEDVNIPSTHRLRISPQMVATTFGDEMRTVARDYDALQKSQIQDTKPIDSDGAPEEAKATPNDKAKLASLDQDIQPGLLEEDPEQLQEQV